ncbi:hypothetical protein TH63_13780 [Rufibacter radiotolerans]|uniref:Uncharacterized protein n=1 Tax=Rufibacter radiotolerans TaxID=1379910 RepID=A0A0H4VR85_9BACT|nr:hypothetical protein TH63_13780 [Rufibacter radiotolerans]
MSVNEINKEVEPARIRIFTYSFFKPGKLTDTYFRVAMINLFPFLYLPIIPSCKSTYQEVASVVTGLLMLCLIISSKAEWVRGKL